MAPDTALVDKEEAGQPAQAQEVAAVGGRVYIDPVTNERFPSVTTILGATSAKHGIADWTAKMAAEYAVDYAHIWQPIASTPEAGGREAAVDLIRKAAERHRDAAGARGSFVHGVIESIVVDKALPLIEPDSNEEKLLDAFLRWYIDYEVEFFMAELTVANRKLRYAGTLDGGVILRACSGRRLLIDVKTGKRVWAEEAGPQMVGYRGHPTAPNEVWLPNGAKDSLPEVDGVATLHLYVDEHGVGQYEFVELVADDAAWEDFENAVRKYWSARKLSGKKRIVGRVRRDNDPWYVSDFVSLTGCQKALADVGLTTLEQLVEFNKTQLMAIKGFGPKSFEAVVAAMSSVGLAIQAA